MSFTNADVAHRWMTGIGDSCRGSNMYFEGDTIYSYGAHFVIARKWNGVILWNDRTYSNSTSKHQGYVRSAAWGQLVDCAVLEYRDNPASQSFYEKNMKEWREQIEHIVAGPLAKARKPERYYDQIEQILAKAERLCEVLGRELPKELAVYKESNPDREEMVRRIQEEKRKREEKAEQLRKKIEKERIEKFLNFERNYADTRYQIVRLNREKNRFETSLHVEIPFEIGKRFYEALKNGELKVGDKVLFYVVREVGKVVRIGCHTFEKKWLLEYGKKVFNE